MASTPQAAAPSPGAYAERPAARLPATTWWSRTAGGEVLVLPDGCIDVLWVDGALVVAGPDRRARLHRSAPGAEVGGVRLHPGVGPALLGVPADELVDQVVPLADVVGRRRAHRASAAAERAGAGAERATQIEATLQALGEVRGDDLAQRAARLLGAGRPVAAVADDLGWSERTLQRQAARWFGYRPKHLARILRLQRALSLGRAAAPPARLAAVAAAAGYADQAHLARDARDLTGTTATALLGRGELAV